MNNYQRKRIMEALDYLAHLTPWEVEFIENIAALDQDYVLTSNQNHQLNRISEKIGEI